ncbi:hypothetical protein RRG49_04525 [Mycoplasmopsis felis]|uniref:hypothetical protein n=1 Tax=Mycoplasmopsis felis TaxID=33923 RepID=UPI002B00361C|nr:hypothetical protein [Mycoplasmopsis felis]WQQ09680.1 hypothetical protein RRG41_01970 [Mycoplasmopsis felis]
MWLSTLFFSSVSKNDINPYTHLYGIRSFSYNGSSHEIEWLMKNGVKVINLS